MKKFDYFATGLLALIMISLSLWAGSRGWAPYKIWGMALNLKLVVFAVAIIYLIVETIRLKSMLFMTLLGCLTGLLIGVPTHVFYPRRYHSIYDTTSLIIFTITYGMLGLIISIYPAVKKSRSVAFEKLKSIGDPDSIDVLKSALKHAGSICIKSSRLYHPPSPRCITLMSFNSSAASPMAHLLYSFIRPLFLPAEPPARNRDLHPSGSLDEEIHIPD